MHSDETALLRMLIYVHDECLRLDNPRLATSVSVAIQQLWSELVLKDRSILASNLAGAVTEVANYYASRFAESCQAR